MCRKLSYYKLTNQEVSLFFYPILERTKPRSETYLIHSFRVIGQRQKHSVVVLVLSLSFEGGYSLHGVTKVEGIQPRMTGIFTYDEQPVRVLSDEVNIQIYGPRVEKILSERRLSQGT